MCGCSSPDRPWWDKDAHEVGYMSRFSVEKAIRHAQDVAARYAVEQMATKVENLTHYRMYDEDEPDDDSNYVFVLKLSEVEDANEAFTAALAEAQEQST